MNEEEDECGDANIREGKIFHQLWGFENKRHFASREMDERSGDYRPVF